MSHHQSHRGAAPKDERLFGLKAQRVLQTALVDLCWLLDHGYAIRSASVLVGDRHCLASRQRMAVARCACTEAARRERALREVKSEALAGRELWLDGFNVLTILETARAGGVILVGRDGCCRDVMGVHRRYRKVQETVPVLQLLAATTGRWGVARSRWFLDEPVSNSGRLKALILDLAAQGGWPWEVELVPNPDRVLSKTDQVVASSDCVVLDRCQRWHNLVRGLITERIPEAQIVDLSSVPG